MRLRCFQVLPPVAVAILSLVALDQGSSSFAQSPLNDFLASALKVPSERVWTHTVSNQLATIEGTAEQALAHGGVADAAASVWYALTVREPVDVLVDTAGSTFTTVVGVYSGPALTSLTRVPSETNTIPGRDAWARFTAQPNISYKIAVAGVPPNSVGLVRVKFELGGEPDLTPPILEITRPSSGASTRTPRMRIEGTAFDPQPNGSGIREVQYSLGIEGNAIIRNAQGTTNFALSLDLTQGANTVTLWALDQADNRSIERRVTVFYTPVTSTNDFFFDRLPLSLAVPSRSDSTAGATKEANEPAHAGNPGGSSIWYEFRSEEPGVLLLNTAGSNFDTVLAVYRSAITSPLMTNLVELASNDDVPAGGGYSEVTITVVEEESYYIAVDGYDGQAGTVQLNYQFNPMPVYHLEVLPSIGSGSVSVPGGYYPANATVTIEARPAGDAQFDYFETPGGQMRQNPLTWMMTDDLGVRAVFKSRGYSEDFEGGFKFSFASTNWMLLPDPTNRWNQVFGSLGEGRDRITNTASVLARVNEGIGSFDYGVSTETNYDRLEFYVSYVQEAQPSGPVLLGKWSGEGRGRHQFAVRPGTILLEWRMVKDVALSGGADRVFIDNLDLPLFAAQSALSMKNQTVTLRVMGLGNERVRIERSDDLADWSFVDTGVTGANGELSFQEPAQGSARFYRFIPLSPSGH